MGLISKATKGIVNQSHINVLYGDRGLGKSTFVSHFPNTLVLDIEDGTGDIVDINRLGSDVIPNYEALASAVVEFEQGGHEHKTLGIDSATQLEKYIIKHECERKGIKDFTEVPFRVKDLVVERLGEFFSLLRKVQKKGYNVWIIGHVISKKINDPTLMNTYDRFTIEADDKFGRELLRLADNVFFVKNNIDVTLDKSKRGKATTDGKHTLYTNVQPSFEAKNRLSLPSEINFNNQDFIEAVNLYRPQNSSTVIADIKALLIKLQPHDPAMVKLAEEKLLAAGDDNSQLQRIKSKLIEATKAL